MLSKSAIPLIILAQFCCTSLWFAGNAVIVELGSANNLDGDHLVLWTVMVQLGFIIGTFVMAFLLLADRYSPTLLRRGDRGLAHPPGWERSKGSRQWKPERQRRLVGKIGTSSSARLSRRLSSAPRKSYRHPASD